MIYKWIHHFQYRYMQWLFSILTITTSLFAAWLIYQKDLGVSNDIINYVAAWPNGDKIGHFVLFGSVAFCAVIASRYKKINLGQYLPVYLASVVVGVLVIIEEISQMWFTTRTFEFADIAANLLGITMFSLLAYVLDKWFSGRATSMEKSSTP